MTKLSPCQWGHKMYLSICWPNPTHASEDAKWNSTCIVQSQPLPAWMQNASQQELSKDIPWQRIQNMHLNMWWPNPSHSSEDTKCILTCVDQIHPMPEITQMCLNLCWSNPFHASEETNYISTSHESEDTKYFSTCVDQIFPMPARTQNVSQHVLT